MTAIIKLQKTGYYVTISDSRYDQTYIDAEGHSWFSKALARQIAKDSGGMYYDGNRSTIKEVVVGYTDGEV